MVADLGKKGTTERIHSPDNSPVRPVKKETGRRRFTVNYRQLNANYAPFTAAVPNIAQVVTPIQGLLMLGWLPWVFRTDFLTP